jgi:hypothetical protein
LASTEAALVDLACFVCDIGQSGRAREQERFDLVVRFSNFAAFDHSNVVSHFRALSSCFALTRFAGLP